MIGLPKATEFNKRIPKQKFYENLTMTPALRDAIKDQIKTIYWRNKIAPTVLNLAAGNNVTEIEVFEIKLTGAELDEAVLRQIDKEIPYHILFLLESGGKYQAWIGYKEAAQSGNNAFRVSGYYHTDWLLEEELPVKLEGLGIDNVYENFVRQIAGEKLQAEQGESLGDSVAKAELKEQLQKQIEHLKRKIKKEKQLNRQMEMKARMKELVKKVEEI